MDLSALIRARRAHQGGTLRDMEDRARQAGYHISRSAISDYQLGKIVHRPSRGRVEALAAALGCTYLEVAAAVDETYRLDPGAVPDVDAQQAQRVQAWLRLVDGRTDDEVHELLLIVEQVLRMRDMDPVSGDPPTLRPYVVRPNGQEGADWAARRRPDHQE